MKALCLPLLETPSGSPLSPTHAFVLFAFLIKIANSVVIGDGDLDLDRDGDLEIDRDGDRDFDLDLDLEVSDLDGDLDSCLLNATTVGESARCCAIEYDVGANAFKNWSLNSESCGPFPFSISLPNLFAPALDGGEFGVIFRRLRSSRLNCSFSAKLGP